MGDLAEGERVEVSGSGSRTYVLRNVGGIYSCTCPAWCNQSLGIERRTCKHLRALRGDDVEQARVGSAELAGRTFRQTVEVTEKKASEGAPPVLLAHKWELDVNLTGWWMSEKLDGVRAYWDGSRFLSRLGNMFYAPSWFTKNLPNEPLDGELWGGRKTFQRTVGIVKRQDGPPEWADLTYVVFDAPSFAGSFEQRVARCKELLPEGTEYVQVLEHVPCRDVAHLREELARVEALGGEGLMMRKPGSRYEAGRSHTLLKVKTFHDAEARVVGHVPGLGRHKGRLGALTVELANGTRFNVGTGLSDAERGAPPAIGSLITFRYQELSDGGVPRFPSYVGERIDGTLEPVSPEPTEEPSEAPSEAPSEVPSEVASEVPGNITRRLERNDGDVHYFWEIEVRGNVHRVRYGTFEAKIKKYADEKTAAQEANRRIEDKIALGFIDVSDQQPR